MAALQIISLETTTPQLRAPASGDTYSAPRALAITPETLTGSSATSSLSIAQTWNTTGTPTAIDLNVTDTASNASSLLMNLRVGGTSRLSVDKTGAVVISDGSNALTIDSTNGTTTFLQTAQMAFQTSNALILRHGNGDAVGVRAATSGDPRLDFLNTSNALQVRLTIDAANTLAQRNGVNAQVFRVYGTFTDSSNYQRLRISTATIFTENAGTGAAQPLSLAGTATGARMVLNPDGSIQFYGASVANIWNFSTAGHFLAATDNTYDIGASGANRPRNAFWGGYQEMSEMTAPAAPAANSVRIYAEDNGSGKTRLMALFATGAAQVIAVEP